MNQEDICDVCGCNITLNEGLVITGEDIHIRAAGSKTEQDLFNNDGSYAPMNGRVSVSLCKGCLNNKLQ